MNHKRRRNMGSIGMTWIALLLFGFSCAVQDIRTKKIYIGTYIIFGLLGLLTCFIKERGPMDIAAAMIPGAILYLLSRITGGEIGAGDALWFVTAGLFCGIREIIFIFSMSCFLCIIAALLMVFVHRKDLRRVRKHRIPFLAFLPLPIVLGAFI